MSEPQVGLYKILNSFDFPALLISSERKIIFVNNSLEKYFKKSSSFIIGKPVSNFFPELTNKNFNSFLKSKQKSTYYYKGNSKKIDINLSITKYKQERTNQYLLYVNEGIKENTKEKLKLHEELLESRKLNALFHNVDVLLWSVKRDSKGILYYEKVNEAFAAATNRKPKDYNGVLLKNLGSKADYESIEHSLALAKENSVYTYERELTHRNVTKYYSIRIIYVQGENNTEYYMGSAVDVTPTKKSEELARLNEKKYRDLAQYAPVALTRVNPNTGKFEFVNDEFIRQSGFTREEFHSLSRNEQYMLIDPEDRDRVLKSIDDWFKRGYKGVLHNRYRATNRENKTLWLDAYFYADFNKNNKVEAVNQIYLDITEIKHTEELLRFNEKMYKDLSQYAPFGIAHTDVRKGLYEYVNDEFTRQSGYTLEEFNSLTDKQITEMVYPEDREKHTKAIKDWVNNGHKGVLRVDYRVYNKKKEIVWLDAYFYAEFDEDKKLKSINQIYLDVTGQKENEQKIQLLANAIESTAEMISITDLSNNFIFVNSSFLNTYGYKENEIIGKSSTILYALESQRDIENEIYTATLKGGWSGELLNKRKDGSEFPVHLSTAMISDPLNNIIGLINVANDITQMKETEEDLRRSLLEKEILLKEVYHRVKNNLQVINSLLQIQSLSLTDPAVKEMFKESQRRIRIMSMIHEKLYKSKDLTKIDFSNYIFGLVDYIKQSYPVTSDKVKVTVQTHNVSLGLNAAISCGLIINELVSNSYKYAFLDGEEGKISVKLNSEKDEFYNLIVEDNGKGIPDSIDFKNTETLGMVIVNSFVDDLKGSIDLDRTRGTKFKIKFPYQ